MIHLTWEGNKPLRFWGTLTLAVPAVLSTMGQPEGFWSTLAAQPTLCCPAGRKQSLPDQLWGELHYQQHFGVAAKTGLPQELQKEHTTVEGSWKGWVHTGPAWPVDRSTAIGLNSQNSSELNISASSNLYIISINDKKVHHAVKPQHVKPSPESEILSWPFSAEKIEQLQLESRASTSINSHRNSVLNIAQLWREVPWYSSFWAFISLRGTLSPSPMGGIRPRVVSFEGLVVTAQRMHVVCAGRGSPFLQPYSGKPLRAHESRLSQDSNLLFSEGVASLCL